MSVMLALPIEVAPAVTVTRASTKVSAVTVGSTGEAAGVPVSTASSQVSGSPPT
jgi:hypothetical protein